MVKVLLPSAYQELFSDSRYTLIEGGRASAKSHSVASWLILTGAQKRMRCMCGREVQKSLAASVHRLLGDKINALGLGNIYRITREGIFGPHGTHFSFHGLKHNPDNIKSMEDLDAVWIEEADRLSDYSLRVLTPTLRNPKSRLIFTMNRKDVNDPVDAMFFGGEPPPNSKIIHVSWRDNPFFPRVSYDEMMWLKKRDREMWLHVWEGKPLSRSEARVFNNWQVDDIDDQIPPGAGRYYGADWGFGVDPACLIEVIVWGRTLYIRREAWALQAPIDMLPALFAGTDGRQRWSNPKNYRGIENARRSRIIADSSRPDIIRYMNDRGFNIVGADKGPGSVEQGVQFIQSYDVTIHPDCKHAIDEFTFYQFKTDPHTNKVLPILLDKKNHIVDSVRYALEGERAAAALTPLNIDFGGKYRPGIIR